MTEMLHVKYQRSTDIGGKKGEITERYVIPTVIPTANMKAIDVSQLSVEERQNLLSLFKEYSNYRDSVMKTLFSFDDWLEHTGNDNTPPVTWRTFKMDNLEVLD